jgi:hypothetical protein
MNGGEIIPNSYPITSVGVNHPVQVRLIEKYYITIIIYF